MQLLIAAVGHRRPAWAEAAYQDYAKRFPPELRLELKLCKTEPRTGKASAQLTASEARRIGSALPKGVHRVVLDEHGKRVTTVQLAERLGAWMSEGRDVAFIVGGPDGLDAELKSSANETLRLSDLTLPHALIPVMLAEALYRAWSLRANHPYHRD